MQSQWFFAQYQDWYLILTFTSMIVQIILFSEDNLHQVFLLILYTHSCAFLNIFSNSFSPACACSCDHWFLFVHWGKFLINIFLRPNVVTFSIILTNIYKAIILSPFLSSHYSLPRDCPIPNLYKLPQPFLCHLPNMASQIPILRDSTTYASLRKF